MNNIDKIMQVIEVDSAEFLVGDLFKRRFNTATFPQEPHHFVAFVKLPNASFLTLGYVHYYPQDEDALCGGLVIDERNYRKLPHDYRTEIKLSGGIAEVLLRASFSKLPKTIKNIWGYVGDPQAEKVDLRVGFEKTHHQYIFVIWGDPELSEREKNGRIQKIADIGPF
jgi:hypothetical protein